MEARVTPLALIDGTDALRKDLDIRRQAGLSMGLVPTMGALHAGHLSLIARSAAECDVTAVSVFVNPLQFGPGEDFDTYPRDLDGDSAKAAGAGADLVFAPQAGEMFPRPNSTEVTVGDLSSRLEGASRPGHLTGVATVVTKLLCLAGPCRAYFGEKDFQQLAVVRRLVGDLSLSVEVVGCPTVRDGDGLALSSRNGRLNSRERQAATVLFRALRAGVDLAATGAADAEGVRRRMAEIVREEPLAILDYAEVVHAEDLRRPQGGQLRGDLRLLVAATVGPVRLIDNMGVSI